MTPTAIGQTAEGPVVLWRDLGNLDLDQPFFRGAVERAQRLSGDPQVPFRAAPPLRTGLDALAEAAAARSGLPLAGLIFHMTHCGSTLISQALGSLPQVLALGEPEPVGDLATLAGTLPAGQGAAALRNLVGVLGRARRAPQRHMLIKAWSPLACHLPLFREAFLATPWVFVYRDPVEVLVALLESGGSLLALQGDAARAASLLGLDGDRLDAMTVTEFAAQALARICDAVVAAADGACLVVDYDSLPAAIWQRIAPHFGIELDAGMRDRVAQAAGRDAKSPGRAFRPDGAAKRARASAEVCDAAQRWVAPAFERVRALPQA